MLFDSGMTLMCPMDGGTLILPVQFGLQIAKIQ